MNIVNLKRIPNFNGKSCKDAREKSSIGFPHGKRIHPNRITRNSPIFRYERRQVHDLFNVHHQMSLRFQQQSASKQTSLETRSTSF